MSILQRLYDSEINVAISSFWDDGFYVKLGDGMNGYRAEGLCRTWHDVEEWLTAMARIHYPTSDFALGRSDEGSQDDSMAMPLTRKMQAVMAVMPPDGSPIRQLDIYNQLGIASGIGSCLAAMRERGLIEPVADGSWRLVRKGE